MFWDVGVLSSCLGDRLSTAYCRLLQYFPFVGAEIRCLFKDHFFYLKVRGSGGGWGVGVKGRRLLELEWQLVHTESSRQIHFWFGGGWVIASCVKDKTTQRGNET